MAMGGSHDMDCELLADGRVPFGTVARRAFPYRVTGFHCVLLAAPKDIDRAALGEYASLVDIVSYGFPVFFMMTGPAGVTSPMLLEVSIEDSPFVRATVRGFARSQMIDLRDPAGGDFLRAVASPSVQGVRILPRDTDTMARVVDVVAAVTNAVPRSKRGNAPVEVAGRR
jgi:hypothetical protein